MKNPQRERRTSIASNACTCAGVAPVEAGAAAAGGGAVGGYGGVEDEFGPIKPATAGGTLECSWSWPYMGEPIVGGTGE
jgi:hypothetical protein